MNIVPSLRQFQLDIDAWVRDFLHSNRVPARLHAEGVKEWPRLRGSLGRGREIMIRDLEPLLLNWAEGKMTSEEKSAYMLSRMTDRDLLEAIYAKIGSM